MSSLSGLVCFLRRSWLRLEWTIMQTVGFDRQMAPALVQGPGLLPLPLPENEHQQHQEHSFLDNIFWMAAPKKRRTIEVNRCRRRNPNNLIEVKTNIVPCPECGHLKMKHMLCGFCYEKVRRETAVIRRQIQAMEGGPLKTPAVPRVVVYQGETPQEGDEGKQIIERNRKRPSWFTPT
ncbi:39S ribosomal protein L32, mitochondrial [Anguilla rostrata]|uniref:39S ribosomal protein L32, mitochondrial n=1 Tax=Anguilla rostrata TaxID=7938 RepID=UPI0030CB29EA